MANKRFYTHFFRFVQDFRHHRSQLKVDIESPVTCPECKDVVPKVGKISFLSLWSECDN